MERSCPRDSENVSYVDGGERDKKRDIFFLHKGS